MYIVATADFRLATVDLEVAKRCWQFFRLEDIAVEFWLDPEYEV